MGRFLVRGPGLCYSIGSVYTGRAFCESRTLSNRSNPEDGGKTGSRSVAREEGFVNTVEFLGIYTARGDYRLPTLPVENESGLWQAWRAPNGSYVVQPLDYTREPWGSHSIISADDFEENFCPLPSDEAIAMAGKGLLRSDSPDLLEFWYEQALNYRSDKDGLMPGSALGLGRKRGAPVSAQPPEQEPQFFPLEEPGYLDGEAFFELMPPPETVAASRPLSGREAPAAMDRELRLEIDPPPPAPGPAESWLAALNLAELRESEPSPPGEGIDAPLEFGLPAPPQAPADDAAPAKPPGDASGASDPFAEERVMVIENAMYSEFGELIEQLDESSHPALEAEIERLLRRGSGFTWRQKFMFSEFGMALRRKKKFHLALQSHMRALALAPTDEHVLFNVARSEYDLGNVDKACDYLEKALISDPRFKAASNFLMFLTASK